MLSFWEKNSFVNYDVIIVGSGITGLSCAAHIKEANPDLDVLVLERGTFPSGASTKNAGFACFGSLTELIDDLSTMSTDQMLQLVELRWKGLTKLRHRLGDQHIGFLNHGGYELITANEEPQLNHLETINNDLKSIFGKDVFELANHKIETFGFNKSVVKQLVLNSFESQIDTGAMMRSLLAYCQQLGIMVINGSGVERIEEGQHGASVVTEGGVQFHGRHVAITTNAFTKKLFPELTLKPGRGIVLITAPVKNLPFQGTFHYDQGYYYFRNYGDQVILGGGRNLDFERETTTAFEINEMILDKLKSLLNDVILPKHDYEIAHTWAGIMAFGENKEPIMQKHSDHVFLGVRMGGMGVAIGSMIGEQIGNMILNQQ